MFICDKIRLSVSILSQIFYLKLDASIFPLIAQMMTISRFEIRFIDSPFNWYDTWVIGFI